MKDSLIGEVQEIIIDYGCGVDTFMTINGESKDFDTMLYGFEGKKVVVTIEEYKEIKRPSIVFAP